MPLRFYIMINLGQESSFSVDFTVSFSLFKVRLILAKTQTRGLKVIFKNETF